MQITSKSNVLPYPYSRLSEASRLLIGLTLYSTAKESEIAELMSLNIRDFREFSRQVVENCEGRYVFSSGLPAMYGEALPEGEKVFCVNCGRAVIWIPCVMCCQQSDQFVCRQSKDRKRRLPLIPTREMPGTLAKIAVLRDRLAKGLILYHPDDAEIED